MSEGIWAPGCLFPLTEIVFIQVEAKGNEMLKSLYFERERSQVRGGVRCPSIPGLVDDVVPGSTPLAGMGWGVFHVLSLEVSFKLYILCFW